MSAVLLQRACGCAKQDERKLQRRAASGAAHSGFAPPIVHAVLRGSGVALDERARPLAQRILGPDFARVRIHTDARAAESASAVGALAYTVGPHIVFGGGRFAPGTAAGDQLLAHELAHVAQQGGAAIPSALAIGAPDTAFEHQADRIAQQAHAVPHAIAPASLMRAAFFDCGTLHWNRCLGKPCKTAKGEQSTCTTRPKEGGGKECYCPDPYKPNPEERLREILPEWVVALLSAAALALIVACFATGVCEAAALVTACGAAIAFIVIAALREAGVELTEA